MWLISSGDVIIFYRNSCQHAKDIDEVQQLHSYPEVTIKLPNCHVFQKKSEYSGYTYILGGLRHVQ